jgi:hypothetical protein
MLHKASALWARIELSAAAILAAAITLLILLNVVTRAFGQAIYWVDEAAIYTMAWMTFLAGSAAVHLRKLGRRDAAGGCAAASGGARVAHLQGPLRAGLRRAHGLVPSGAGTCRSTLRGRASTSAPFRAPRSTSSIRSRRPPCPSRNGSSGLVMWSFAFGLVLHSLSNLLGGGGASRTVGGDMTAPIFVILLFRRCAHRLRPRPRRRRPISSKATNTVLFDSFALQMFGGLENYGLLAIPLFMLTGELMNEGGVTKRLIAAARVFVGGFRGGLAWINLVANMFMAAIVGSAASQIAHHVPRHGPRDGGGGI